MPKSTSRKPSRNRVFTTIPNSNPKTPKNPVSHLTQRPQETGFLRQYLTQTQKLRKNPVSQPTKTPRNRVFATIPNSNPKTPKQPGFSTPHELQNGKYIIEAISAAADSASPTAPKTPKKTKQLVSNHRLIV